MASSDSIFNTSSAKMDVSSVKESSSKNPEDKVSKQVETASKGATHVVYEILYDRSGSMIQMPTAPEALQNFVTQQKEFCQTNNITSRFTLTVFDSVAEKVPKFDDVDLRKVDIIPTDSLTPRGYTRLVDTALEQISQLKEKIKPDSTAAATEDKPEWRGIFVILTDGQDNQSRNSGTRLRTEIRELTESGVQCYFLGANQDAIHTGENYGFSEDQSLTYAGAAALEAMRSASNNIATGLSQSATDGATVTQPGFSQLQREVSGGTQETVPQFSHPSRRRSFTGGPIDDTVDDHILTPIVPPLAIPPMLTRQLAGMDYASPPHLRRENTGTYSPTATSPNSTLPL